VVLALGAWGFFQPDFRPDVEMVSPSVRDELAKTGFISTQRVTAARFETVEWDDGHKRELTSRQKLVPIDALITEKRSRRYPAALGYESSGLYVGPITVVRLTRSWPPVIGNLLPYHFWMSSRMSEFIVEEKYDFPHAKGGRMLARVTYEDRHADGEPAQTQRVRLRCDIANVVDAASVDTRFSGLAARIDCKEALESEERAAGASTSRPAPGDHRYSHWYILDRGWSIPIEGEIMFHAENFVSTRRWTSRLISFE
jgi:hypothetical protein